MMENNIKKERKNEDHIDVLDDDKTVVRVMVINATFNNISSHWWISEFLVEKAGMPGENHRPVASHRQTSHIMLYRVSLA